MIQTKERPCTDCAHRDTITHRTGYPKVTYCRLLGDFGRANRCQPEPATLAQLIERIQTDENAANTD